MRLEHLLSGVWNDRRFEAIQSTGVEQGMVLDYLVMNKILYIGTSAYSLVAQLVRAPH